MIKMLLLGKVRRSTARTRQKMTGYGDKKNKLIAVVRTTACERRKNTKKLKEQNYFLLCLSTSS